MKKILVTGGAGFIGSHLIDKLLADKDKKVVVIDDFSTGYKKNIEHHSENPDFKLICGNICSDLSHLFEKENPDAVVHLAAQARVQRSLDDPEGTYRVNVWGTRNLLLAAKEFEAERFVFISSSSVYGTQDKMPLKETMDTRPMSPYAEHKVEGEHLCNAFFEKGLRTIAIRPFNVYGPKQDPEGPYACLIPRTISNLKKGQSPVIFGDGTKTRDFTYVDDIAAAILSAVDTPNADCFGQVFNAAAGKNHSVNEVVGLLTEYSGTDITPAYRQNRAQEPQHTLADTGKAKKFLGYAPKTQLKEGLRKTYESS